MKFVVTEWYGRSGAAELMPYVDSGTRMLSAAELSEGWLLACQTLPTADMTIRTEAF